MRRFASGEPLRSRPVFFVRRLVRRRAGVFFVVLRRRVFLRAGVVACCTITAVAGVTSPIIAGVFLSAMPNLPFCNQRTHAAFEF